MQKPDLAIDAGSYRPAAIYYIDSDCIEYVRSDCFCIYERVDSFLTLIKDGTGHELVGFKLKGHRNLFEQLKPALKLSDNLFLPLMLAIEAVCTQFGDRVFGDEKRFAAYRAAYKLAANDNVCLFGDELSAA